MHNSRNNPNSRSIRDFLCQDTTGALLLARGRPQAREFQVQFRERRVGKTYLALVQAGRDAFPDASGSIRNVLAYDLDGRFCTILPGKVNTSGGEDVSGMQWVGDIGKTVETITHWKLLGSSVRPLPFSSRFTREPGTLC